MWCRQSSADMAGHWILYLAALVLCRIFCGVVPLWQGWLLLLSLLSLPVLSLLLSLPAVLTLRLSPDIPEECLLGDGFPLLLHKRCLWLCPPIRCRFTLWESVGDKPLLLRPGKVWTPAHCGVWRIQLHRCRVYDYCGLFRFPIKGPDAAAVYVLPAPIPAAPLEKAPTLQEQTPPGGQSPDDCNLRQYRPGDGLNRIHWKLSAKTGNLICREHIAPVRSIPEIQLQLSGNRKTRDYTLGQLRWLSEKLLARQIPHQIRCRTGNGLYHCKVFSPEALRQALRTLVSTPSAPGRSPQSAQVLLFGGRPDDAI